MSVVTRAKKYNIKRLQQIAETLGRTIRRVQKVYNELKKIAENGEKIDEDYKWYLADHFRGMILDPVILMTDEEYREEFQEHLKYLESFHDAVMRQLNHLRTKEKAGKNISYKQDELNFKKEVTIKVNEAILKDMKRVVVRSYDNIPKEAIDWVQTLNGVASALWAWNPNEPSDVNYKAMVINMK